MLWSTDAIYRHICHWIDYDGVLLEEKSYAKYMVLCMRKESEI